MGVREGCGDTVFLLSFMLLKLEEFEEVDFLGEGEGELWSIMFFNGSVYLSSNFMLGSGLGLIRILLLLVFLLLRSVCFNFWSFNFILVLSYSTVSGFLLITYFLIDESYEFGVVLDRWKSFSEGELMKNFGL